MPIRCSALVSTPAQFELDGATVLDVGPGEVLLTGDRGELTLLRFSDDAGPTTNSLALQPIPLALRSAASTSPDHYVVFGHSQHDSNIHIWHFQCTSECRQVSHLAAAGRTCDDLGLAGASCEKYDDAVQTAATENARLRCLASSAGCYRLAPPDGPTNSDESPQAVVASGPAIVLVQVAERLGFAVEHLDRITPALFVFSDPGSCTRPRPVVPHFTMSEPQLLQGGSLALVATGPMAHSPQPQTLRNANYIVVVRFSSKGVPIGHPVSLVRHPSQASAWLGACTTQRCLLAACEAGRCTVSIVSLSQRPAATHPAPAGGCR